MKTYLASCLVSGLLLTAVAQEAKPLYENSFEKTDVDKVPSDFLVLDGSFTVKKEGDNQFLELPGAPLDTFGALFGPTEKENVVVAARILGTGKGRLFPTFGLGLNGAGGYRLQVSPGKKMLEVYKGDAVRASVPFKWESGTWLKMRLQVRKTEDGAWKVEGKAWSSGTAEPAQWTVAVDETEEPTAGRAAVWGSPYSGTPIRYDDLRVTPAAAGGQ